MELVEDFEVKYTVMLVMNLTKELIYKLGMKLYL